MAQVPNTQNGVDQQALHAFKLGKTSSVTYKGILDGQQVSVSITRP